MSIFDFDYFKNDLVENKPIIFRYIEQLKNKYTCQENDLNKRKEDIKYADLDDKLVMLEDLYVLEKYKLSDPGFRDIKNVNDIKNPYFFFCMDSTSPTYISSMNVNIFDNGKCIIPFTSARAGKLRYEDIGTNKFRLEIKDGNLILVKALSGEAPKNNGTSIYSEKVRTVWDEMKERGEITGGEKKVGVGDISKLLQSEQNDIMMASPDGITFITGVAGSGKTNILLHRIQYLLWEQPGKTNENEVVFHQDKMLFLCYNKSLQKYIESSIKGKFPEISVKTIDLWLYDLFKKTFQGDIDITKDCDFSYEDAKQLVDDYFGQFASNYKFFLRRTDNKELIKLKSKLFISEHLNKNVSTNERKRGYIPEYLISLNPKLLNEIFGEKIEVYTKKHIYLWLYLLSITDIYDEKNSLDSFKMKIGEYEFNGLKVGKASYVYYIFDKMRYDHIFIDEVQDLSPLDIQIVNGFHNNSITLAGDETQLLKNDSINMDLPSYFGLNKYKFNKYELGMSYRNSQQTALFANEFIKNVKVKNPIKNISFRGLKPIVREVSDFLEEFKYLNNKIRDLQSNEPEATICVLYPSKEDVDLCGQTLLKMGLDCYVANGKTWDFKRKIHISNYFQAKGLEFDYVFICGLNNFDTWNRKNKETILYTLVTRGVKRVYMVYSGDELPNILKNIDESTYEYQYS